MENIYESAINFLNRRESIALAILIANSGSTPREAGAKMIIRENGEIIGTIGGGKIEVEVIKQAIDLIKNKKSIIKNYDLTKDGIASIGMICGGNASVYIQYLDASDNKIIEQIKRIIYYCSNNKSAWLVTKISENENEYKQYLIEKDRLPEGDEAKIIYDKISDKLTKKRTVFVEADDKYFIEPLYGKSRAIIFGGGHIGLALVPILKSIGFYTIVTDDREEFSSKQRFKDADEVITAGIEEAYRKIAIDSSSYIIIVTRGHLNDYTALINALKTDACYIGMIGSRSKWESQKVKLLEEGYANADIERVHCPIGLKIRAETPEEIAISIAAEIIQEKAEM